MKSSSLLGLVLLAVSTSSVAQTKFCIGGDLDSLSPAAIASCKAKSSDLRAAALLRGVPRDWHFVTVCDEASWKAYASLAGNRRASVVNASENTDRELRFTFVRGSRIAEGRPDQVDNVLASASLSMPDSANAPMLRNSPVMRAVKTPQQVPVLTAMRTRGPVPHPHE